MTVADGRIAAWTAAWQCIESAQKTRADAAKLPENPSNLDVRRLYAHHYDSLLAEARVFAALTAVDLGVGAGAGSWLQQRWEAERDDRAKLAEEFADLFGSKGDANDSSSE